MTFRIYPAGSDSTAFRISGLRITGGFFGWSSAFWNFDSNTVSKNREVRDPLFSKHSYLSVIADKKIVVSGKTGRVSFMYITVQPLVLARTRKSAWWRQASFQQDALFFSGIMLLIIPASQFLAFSRNGLKNDYNLALCPVFPHSPMASAASIAYRTFSGVIVPAS
jgi:hypothetical protein